jgi:two-component system response regulator AtoC
MDSAKPRVLVLSNVEAGALVALLEAQGVEVTSASDEAQAQQQLNERLVDALFIDTTNEAETASLASFREHWPELAAVAFGRDSTSDSLLVALRAGALEYLKTPTDEAALARALELALSHGGSRLSEPPPAEAPASGMLGDSSEIRAVRDAVSRVAAGTASVFVRGENGTGKELVARAVHAQSARSAGPFVKVHAPALPDALLESELFGYEKGAFTGATVRKPGRVELAEGGTLFLDEVADMSAAMQAKLLRLIQDREYERLGGTRTLRADLRFVTATHRDVEHMIDTRAFRQDLFYRLNVVTIWLPPLRARRADIPLIARHYLEVFRVENRKPTLQMSDGAELLLQAQRWPGNVRQLVNFMERLVVMSQVDVIGPAEVRREFDEQTAFTTQSLPQAELSIRGVPDVGEPDGAVEAPRELDFAPLRSSHASSLVVRPLRDEVRRAERHALKKALLAAKNNRTLAARLLGISRRTLYSKLEEHEIT